MIVAELSVHKTGTKLEKKLTSPTVEYPKGSLEPDYKPHVVTSVPKTKEKTFRELKEEFGNTYGCGCKKTDFILCPKHRRA